jgi:hypothetical protein
MPPQGCRTSTEQKLYLQKLEKRAFQLKYQAFLGATYLIHGSRYTRELVASLGHEEPKPHQLRYYARKVLDSTFHSGDWGGKRWAINFDYFDYFVELVVDVVQIL